MLAKLNKYKQERSDKGFTIIEVMIVLAIAGLILLIVFLAVPALQRSSRNTERKTDVGRIGSASTTVLSNNNNVLTDLTTATLQAEIGTLSYYQGSQVTVATTIPSTATNNTTGNTVIVYPGAVCSPFTKNGLPAQGATSAGATNTSIAIDYATETGSGLDYVCVNE
jgi:prepilin-type N-terminal cleavage/methylation domain-containing protein